MTDQRLYPNAGGDGRPRGRGVSRRGVLAGSAAVGTAATAGCLGGNDETGSDEDAASDGTDPDTTEAATVYVFNTGDGTVSLVDVERDEVVETVAVGLTSSFPSNQFSPRLTDATRESLWINAGESVRALGVETLSELASVETGSGANWQERTPDGSHLVVSAREPAHRQFRIDADPNSSDFGAVTGEIDRRSEGGRGTNDGPGPCDVTIHPDGEYAYVPDLFGDTLTVLDVEAFEIHRQIEVDSRDGVPPEPWMGTAAWDGERMLVEHNAGDRGSESIWDVSDPTEPTELARLTPADGLGDGPLTSEIGPDSETGYVFTPGTEDVTVVDLGEEIVVDRLDLGGQAFVGTWDPDRAKLYVPVQTTDEVAVIDHEQGEITTTIDVGAEPYGATSASIRPSSVSENIQTRLASLTGEYETTYCIGECACGHQL
ncbi:hypothetical protein [Halovenus marina]|uniref:hypothetical protein n=1 Tax=Halovenus marina TaxID=3396621 RepID=UPI003F55522F